MSDEFVCAMQNFFSSINISSDTFFGAFLGALFAFIVNWIKNYFDNKNREKANLLETKYILEKYLKYIKHIRSWYWKHRELNFLQPDENQEIADINNQIIRSLRYGIFTAYDLILNLDTSKLTFLAHKNRTASLDCILQAGSQYKKMLYLVDERNKMFKKFSSLRHEMTIPELQQFAQNAEENMHPITLELLRTIWHSREDVKKAIHHLTTYLNSYY